MLFVRVLGPIVVEVDGRVVDVGGRVPRRFFAALATTIGTPVPDDVLAELVWGADQPQQAVATMRVLASRLRTVLGPEHRECLPRTAFGYQLAMRPEWTDVSRFTELIANGTRLLAAADADGAARCFAAALELWRGLPWLELDDAPILSAERARLTELRDGAVEELQAARLAGGQTAAAVADLIEAVTAAPFRERRWELLALGLYRSGRQAQALAELRRVRELLIEELGVEPGPALRAVERRMLDQDPGLLLATPPRPPAVQASAPERPVRQVIGRPLSSFVGRQDELRRTGALVAAGRLVSLVGAAGIGKTRLAVEYCATTDSTADRWLVRLGDVHDPDAVVLAVATALGLVHLAGDPAALVRRALTLQPGLLVLDNCEHLIEPVAALTIQLLDSCPELRVLATSRQSLGIDGEQVLTLEPLAIRAADGTDGPAVRLLLDRVQAARPDWSPGDADLAAAREICTTVDGLPLAIELAAARERTLGLHGIAAHIHDRLDVLGATPRGSLSRHTGLEAAIGWSVDHLSPADRAMLLRLWPFEGGFTWQAAESVRPVETAAGVLATLAALLDRSVVTADLGPGGPRYRLLETMRRYCRDHDPDPAATREAHAAWVREFVAAQTAVLTGHGAGPAYRALAAELPNIRAGIDHDLARDPVAALRTTAALQFAWSSLGLLVDGRNLIRKSLAAATDATAVDRVRGLLALSIVSFHAGDPRDALANADAAAELLDATGGERELLLHMLMFRGLAQTALDDVAATRATMDRLTAEVDRLPTPDWIRGCAQFGEGIVLLLEGKHSEGIEWLRAARALSAECGHLWCQGMADVVLAWTVLAAADDADAAGEAIAAIDRALAAFTEQSNIADALGAVHAGAHGLRVLASPQVAVQLRAAALHHSARVGADPRRYLQFADPGLLERMDRSLSAADMRRAEAAGRQLTWAQMMALIHTAEELKRG
ncbi:AfsR/SARP family transcriptional regulator [Nocardia brasiliensis]|uniref:AfsR/SARP family transcriptional regulator n=3 Tax=Nocardia brasiliensis TaxID=37326 RepID=UPI001894AEBA|nr:BTAD domain-containing putative transcriptional regulator [Nocardia brasiliensis]MBF6127646.1 AfsR/SARP family transcriptional regulator [Nocardia brasiliensis]